MNSLQSTVLKTIQKSDLLQSGDVVFVALSGGADSVALLHTMLALREELGLADIRALHVNHGIRGDFADCDEHFVRQLCNDLCVPLTVKQVDIPATVAQTGESVEDAARRLRYAFFAEETKAVPQSKLATAHTADDQAETVLLHLIRGSGLKGVSGIPVLRGNIIRPLLACTADEVRLFCKENGFVYVVDETNCDLRYARNRVRHEILPSMRKINPSVDRALIRFAQLASEEDRFLDSLVNELLTTSKIDEDIFSVPVLMRAEPVLRKRALYQLCQAEYAHIIELNDCLETGGIVNLPRDRSAVSDGVELRFIQHSRQKTRSYEEYSFPVLKNGSVSIHDADYTARVISYDEYKEKLKIHKNLFDFCISYDMIEHDLVLRSRKPGDCLRPFGRGCTKTLKKLMNDCHIPPDKRTEYPVLVSGDKVLMVLGLCVDETVAVTSATKTVLWFEKSVINTKS